jgi:hypothetical protein
MAAARKMVSIVRDWGDRMRRIRLLASANAEEFPL